MWVWILCSGTRGALVGGCALLLLLVLMLVKS